MLVHIEKKCSDVKEFLETYTYLQLHILKLLRHLFRFQLTSTKYVLS